MAFVAINNPLGSLTTGFTTSIPMLESFLTTQTTQLFSRSL
ncbi:hypothetical protein [Campylobacter coli]|nr:hypothetical protein [Campylobacter coli]